MTGHRLVCHDLGWHVAAEVDDVVAVVFQQHAHDVLADVVDVPVDGTDDDGTLAGRRGLSSRSRGTNDLEASLGGLGRGHELRQEEGALLEATTHLVEGWNEDLVDGVEGIVVLEDLCDCLGNRSGATLEHERSGAHSGVRGRSISPVRGDLGGQRLIAM